ncbi:hypothetical protein [Ruminiclostridium josui]|uniref:hypothetical protein n=1 Tax=Ruminiclostridium josui TaxID=1499 RepID=UPI0004642D91|nr:hypothetical protein [Ruminiclostridium josui]
MNKDRKTYTLSDKELKLKQKSILTYTLLFFPLFGYTINRKMIYFWIGALIIGGIFLAIKSRLIQPKIRMKVMLIEIIITGCLTLWIFSNSISIPGFIKEVIFFLVLIVFFSYYFNLLYNGKLTNDVSV